MNNKPIKTEADCRATMAEIETLMGAKVNSADGNRLDILVALVEAYERTLMRDVGVEPLSKDTGFPLSFEHAAGMTDFEQGAEHKCF